MRPFLPALALLAAISASAAPAGFNVDFGNGSAIPSSDHEGPARQPGHWNVVTGLEPEPVELFDTDGVATSVVVTLSLPFGPSHSDHPGTAGGDEAVLDDYLDLHSVPATLEITGLPPGPYALTTIAWAPDLPGARTSVSVEGRQAQLVGGDWRGAYRRGVTHAVHHVHLKEGEPAILRLFGVGRGSLNGLQVTRHGR